MVIEKILNNNVVITRNLSGVETVIMGRGLAFGHSAGDEVDESKIEKTFTITSKNNRVEEILAKIPVEHMLISEKVISQAKITLGKPINDNIYISLSEHISAAIIRYKDNITYENPLKWDIKRFYPSEYQIALMANKIIEKDMNIKLKDDETAVFALDFVNAQQKEQSLAYNMTKIMQEICQIVSSYLDIILDEDSLAFYRFITHLKFFAQRILSNTHYDDNMNTVLQSVAKQNETAYKCTEKIKEHLKQHYDFQMTSDELLYLCLHISRLQAKE